MNCIYNHLHINFRKNIPNSGKYYSYRFDEAEFKYLSKIVIENIANFGKGLKTISYVFKLYMETSITNELETLINFHKTIQKECEKSFMRTDMLHNSIVKIIDPLFTYNEFE